MIHPQNKAWKQWLNSEKGQSCLKSMNRSHNENILWWVFNHGYEAGQEDLKRTKHLKTISEKRKDNK